MSGLLYRVGRICARRPRTVLLAWAAIALALVAARGGGIDTNDDMTLKGTGSTQAADLLAAELPEQQYGSVPLTLEAPSGRLDDPANARAVERTVDALRDAPHVRSAVSPLSAQGAGALSDDGRIGYVSLTLDVDRSEVDEDLADQLLDAAAPARDAGLDVAVGGYVGQDASRPSTHASEAIGLAAAVVILLFALGTVVAMAMPIGVALVGLVSGLGLIALLSQVVDVPSVGPTLGTMIGLGVGIDYALFLVTAYRAQRAEGRDVREAVARACATAGSAVVFAGGTVVIALCSLALAGIPLVAALGYTAAVVVVVAVLAAVTLLPALLAFAGDRLEALRVPLRNRSADTTPRGWRRWALRVAGRPWTATTVAVALLAVLAAPTLDIRLGQPDVGQLPKDTTARQAYDTLAEGFGPGYAGPLLVAIDLQPAATTTKDDQRVAALQQAIRADSGVASVSPATLAADGDAAVFTAVPTAGPSDEETQQTVKRLRDDVIPHAQNDGTTAYVGGVTAANIDLADRIADKLAPMIAIVVALSSLLLMLAFRSLLIPITAALMNLLSVAAAYGVLTAVFEKGWGAELIGLDHAVPIVSFVPLLMFAVLFGLSMDYQVFLVSRIAELHRQGRTDLDAIVDGLASSARVITSAALIMICVFGSFVLNGDPTIKQFGIGLSVAIAVDATVVRCLLVPATMVLLGRRNWWMPAWLGRVLPRVGLEGEASG
jgi:putative drug exporter of the RND superfamily